MKWHINSHCVSEYFLHLTGNRQYILKIWIIRGRSLFMGGAAGVFRESSCTEILSPPDFCVLKFCTPWLLCTEILFPPPQYENGLIMQEYCSHTYSALSMNGPLVLLKKNQFHDFEIIFWISAPKKRVSY